MTAVTGHDLDRLRKEGGQRTRGGGARWDELQTLTSLKQLVKCHDHKHLPTASGSGREGGVRC